jgi:uncharacterized HAD superfamily protein
MRGNGHGIPIVSLDIDGTIGDYHGHFLRFAEGYFGSKMPDADRLNPSMRLHEFMGVEHKEYQRCKLAYRQGGLKRTMPPLEGIGDLVRWVRIEKAAEVWICTTRPYAKLDNIDEDTQEFLRRADIGYDALLFDPLSTDDKYTELRRQADDRVACVVEDLPEQAGMAYHMGYKVLLRDQPYNRLMSAVPFPYQRWYTVEGLKKLLNHAIDSWRGKKNAD